MFRKEMVTGFIVKAYNRAVVGGNTVELEAFISFPEECLLLQHFSINGSCEATVNDPAAKQAIWVHLCTLMVALEQEALKANLPIKLKALNERAARLWARFGFEAKEDGYMYLYVA